MRSATRRIRSASATEDPPYFCTTSATSILSRGFSGPQQNTCAHERHLTPQHQPRTFPGYVYR
jgi:hypothetical protein